MPGGVSVLANLATLVLVAGVIYLFGWASRRRKLLRFFLGRGYLSGPTDPFRIYLSGLEIRHSPGAFASIWEYSEARDVCTLFDSLIPGPSGNPGLFRTFKLAGVDYEIKPVREADDVDILSNSCLVIGSPMYNNAAREFQEKLSSSVRIVREQSGNLSSPWQLEIPFEAPNQDPMRGVIVRLRRDGRSYFYVAGLTESSTAGALYFLRTKWLDLYKRFGNEKPFLVQVQVTGHDYRNVQQVSFVDLPPPKQPNIGQSSTASLTPLGSQGQNVYSTVSNSQNAIPGGFSIPPTAKAPDSGSKP